MLFRIPCKCGRVFVVGKNDLGTLMTCPGCQQTITVPNAPEPATDEPQEDREEKLFWQQTGTMDVDPSSPEEKEYRRRYSRAAKAKRAAARRPARVRLLGTVWLTAGVILILPALWLASQIHVPNFPWVRRIPGLPVLVPIACVFKGWVEVVTGVRLIEMLRRGDDPRAGWPQFGAWLFLVASIIGALAGTFGLSVVLKELLGLPDFK